MTPFLRLDTLNLRNLLRKNIGKIKSRFQIKSILLCKWKSLQDPSYRVPEITSGFGVIGFANVDLAPARNKTFTFNGTLRPSARRLFILAGPEEFPSRTITWRTRIAVLESSYINSDSRDESEFFLVFLRHLCRSRY